MDKHKGLVAFALMLVTLLGITVTVGFAQPVVEQGLASANAQVARANVKVDHVVSPEAIYVGATVPYSVTKIYLPMVPDDWTYPQFTASKSAEPATVNQDGTVVYTVSLKNEGDLPGALKTVEDTLPPGFTFLGMVAGSGVTAPPNGTTGKIVWNGPFTVAAHGELKLIYQVRASNEPGDYVNRATATTDRGAAAPPQVPGAATVTVKPPYLLRDNFEAGIDNWMPFLNYWRLNDGQWFWDQGVGVNGSDCYTNYGGAGVDPAKPDRGAHDSLSMYLNDGAEQWTDYRFSAEFNLLGGRIAGLWFRGDYEESDTPAQWVTGYYFGVSVGGDTATLWQLRTEEEPGEETNPDALYAWNNPLELVGVDLSEDLEKGAWYNLTVEVEGPHIRGYVNDELVIDYVDDEGSVHLEGAVGLYTYGTSSNYAVVKFDNVLVEPLD